MEEMGNVGYEWLKVILARLLDSRVGQGDASQFCS